VRFVADASAILKAKTGNIKKKTGQIGGGVGAEK
jgi:hypothetical protein